MKNKIYIIIHSLHYQNIPLYLYLFTFNDYSSRSGLPPGSVWSLFHYTKCIMLIFGEKRKVT